MTDFIKKMNIEGENSFVVGNPTFREDGEKTLISGTAGGQNFITVYSADVTNSDTSLNISASEVNRSKQYKNPTAGQQQDPAPGPSGAMDNGHTR